MHASEQKHIWLPWLGECAPSSSADSVCPTLLTPHMRAPRPSHACTRLPLIPIHLLSYCLQVYFNCLRQASCTRVLACDVPLGHPAGSQGQHQDGSKFFCSALAACAVLKCRVLLDTKSHNGLSSRIHPAKRTRGQNSWCGRESPPCFIRSSIGILLIGVWKAFACCL